MSKLIKLATDPEQYSGCEQVLWMKDNKRQEQQRQVFGNAVVEFIDNKHKSVLDLGCGSGWLAEKLSVHGITRYVGIEPSSLNYKLAKSENPNLDIKNEPILQFSSNELFDCVIAIMVMSHIEDVNKVFKKVHSHLTDDGLFIIISSTFHPEERRLERNNRQYKVEVIDDNQYVDRSIGGTGYGIADINRKPEYYIRVAENSGFDLVKHTTVGDKGYSHKDLLVFEKH